MQCKNLPTAFPTFITISSVCFRHATIILKAHEAYQQRFHCKAACCANVSR